MFEVVGSGGIVMELLHERCAALDIGKKELKACVRTAAGGVVRWIRESTRGM